MCYTRCLMCYKADMNAERSGEHCGGVYAINTV
jgi:hypothetical protein